jgi:hypothetical protein
MFPSMSAMIVCCLLVQDAPSVQDLVRKLGHDDIEQRTSAMTELIRLSEAAVPRLQDALASDDLEVAQRAQVALSRIYQLIQLRPVYKERIPFTLDLQGIPAEKVVERISGHSHVGFRMTPSMSERLVTLKMTEGTLLEAADLLCRGLGDTQWYYADLDVIAFRSQPFIPKPSSYTDSFRISIHKIETLRSSNFLEGTGCAALFLEAQVEQGITFLGAPSFSITEAVDDGGNTLTEWVHPLAGIPARMGQGVLLKSEPPCAESQPFCFSGIGASARRLRRIRGTTSFFFSTGSEEAILNDLSNAEPREIGDCTIRILENQAGILKLGLSRNDQPIDLAYFETESVVVTDEDGEQHPLTASDCEGYPLPLNRYTVLTFYFDHSWKLGATRAEFRLTRGVHEMKIPFAFHDVPLP